ncbi:acylase [Erythrobacter sp. 3-20A1M]|uniref:penicillin acylase family protein n=1 Tax=Erythrobacter sp. 3-20A1M TaxID=2653850 RepID=UPI001BFC669B|nr:acylase [Erythrobacter sp. 3-20A1M]
MGGKWFAGLAVSVFALGLSPSSAKDAPRSERVTIVRDGYGIAHIHGRSDADAVFGMIYAQAEDDFPRIERNYLTALGRLAEAEGESAVWSDVRQRLFLDLDKLKADYRTSPDWLRDLMDAWASGLNYYLATHPDTHPKVLTRFEPWMALAFSESSIGGDIERGVDLRALQAFYDGPDRQARPDLVALLTSEAGEMVEPKGSNGIAIGPSRSKSGSPLLWINPHTSFFFRAEQQVSSDAGLDAYGAATWGQFFIYQGFNRHIGWMHTSSGVDNIDEFAVEVRRKGGRLQYRYGTDWRPFRSRTVSLKVRQSDGTSKLRRFTLLSTHHGPVIREENGRWIAVAMLNNPRAALEQSYLRTKAHSLDGYLEASSRMANSSNNTIFAADDGTIAYLHPQFVPRRNDRFDYTRPVDGSDPATDWQGLHDLDQLPQVIRPKGGWAVNTNNHPWSAAGDDSPEQVDFPRYMDQFGENPRGRHAVALLSGQHMFDAKDLTSAAFDSFLPLFDDQIPGLKRGLLALPDGDPRKEKLTAPVAMLDGWDRRWSVTSVPTALAVYWGEALWSAEGPKAYAANVPLFTYFRTQTTDADRLSALDTAVDKMVREQGDWRIAWGRINRFQRIDGAIEQDFQDKAPSFPVGFTSGNFGSLAAFGVVRQSGDRCLYGTSGNSFVAVVEFSPEGPHAWAVSAGGESGDPQSPHFNDQIVRYATGALRPVPFADADLQALTGPRYHPGEVHAEVKSPQPVPGSSPCGQLNPAG